MDGMDGPRPAKRLRLNTPEPDDCLACGGAVQSEAELHPSDQLSLQALPLSEDKVQGGIVCYGMLEQLQITPFDVSIVIDIPVLTDAFLDEKGIVWRSSDELKIGTLDMSTCTSLSTVFSEEGVEIQFMVKSTHDTVDIRSRVTAMASAILYGPQTMADAVGDFLDRCGLYLQEPLGCDRNVPYLNPHCLDALFRPMRMTFDIQHEKPIERSDRKFVPTEFFSSLETPICKERKTPRALKTELLPLVSIVWRQ